MSRKLLLTLEVVVALVALAVGYTLVVGVPLDSGTVAARSSTMPANPHILYLVPVKIQPKALNNTVIENNGVTISQSWQAARSIATERPLDALIIESASLEKLSDSDQKWLQKQFQDGVVIVGLGTADNQLAQGLGIKTLQAPNEKSISVDSTKYRMLAGLALGQPDDVKAIWQSDWVELTIKGEDSPPHNTENLLITSLSGSQGDFNSAEGITELFTRLRLKIEGVYQTRAEYERELQNPHLLISSSPKE